jgi:hypothetical protein
VTSHVEGITADVITAEITRLEAELAGHDPDDGTDAYPARQPGTRRWPHLKSRSEMEATTTKPPPERNPPPVKDQS